MSLIRVFLIPAPNFHLGSSDPQTFFEVDWFRDDMLLALPEGGPDVWQESLTGFIKKKGYFDGRPLLVMAGDGRAFTVGYSAP